MKWYPVWLRNIKVWRKLVWPSLLGNFGEPLIYLLALGFGLGHFISTLGGMPYIVFLASGIVCSSAMNTASFEGMYSAFTRMEMQGIWQAMLTTPLQMQDVVLGEVIWAGTKSLISASAIIIVSIALGLVANWHVTAVLPLVFLVGCTFGAMGLVVTSFAKSYDFFLYYFTLLITPMMLLSGVFFPLDNMPATVQWAAAFLPLYHAVHLIRPLMTGGEVTQPLLHIGVILLYAVAAYRLATALLRRRMID